MRALDLCCGAGGTTRGLQLAGFHVTGVDIEPQPDYVGEVFVQDDAVDYCRRYGAGFDLIVAGWPCQKANPLTTGSNAAMNRRLGRDHPQLIPVGREAMIATGRPGIIENTAGGPIRHDLALNGDMFRTSDGGFELAVWRPRFFEFLNGITIPQPDGPRRPSRGRTRGWRHGQFFEGPYFAVYGDGGGKGTVEQWQAAMGIDWTRSRHSLAEAIPPPYFRYIGEHAMAHLRQERAA